MKKTDLIDMMFEGRSINEFEVLLHTENTELEWGHLLHLSRFEKSYEEVGGDCGDEKDPPINRERIEYLEKLIAFLELNGIKEEEQEQDPLQ